MCYSRFCIFSPWNDFSRCPSPVLFLIGHSLHLSAVSISVWTSSVAISFVSSVLGFSSPWWVLWLKCHVRHLLYVWDRFSFDTKFRFIYFFYFFECLILWSSRLLDYFIHSGFLVSKQLPKSYRLSSHKLGCGLELRPRALHVLGKGSPSYLDATVCARERSSFRSGCCFTGVSYVILSSLHYWVNSHSNLYRPIVLSCLTPVLGFNQYF